MIWASLSSTKEVIRTTYSRPKKIKLSPLALYCMVDTHVPNSLSLPLVFIYLTTLFTVLTQTRSSPTFFGLVDIWLSLEIKRDCWGKFNVDFQ